MKSQKNNKKKQKDISTVLEFIIIGLLLILIALNIVLFIYKNEENKAINNDENIVFFGDSLTEKYILERYYPNKNVVNLGISGNKTEDLVNRINDVYKYNPSKVFLLIGGNDLRDKVEKEDILYNIQTIINGIKRNRKYAKIYIESIYPTNEIIVESLGNDFINADNKTISSVNKGIKKIAKESDITYINVFSKLKDKNNNLKEIYTVDGVHLNNLGYLKVTSVLDKYIEE